MATSALRDASKGDLQKHPTLVEGCFCYGIMQLSMTNKLATNSRHEHIARWFFIIISAGVLFLFWKILEPYAMVLLSAGVFAIVFSPFDGWLRRRLRRPRLTALLTVLLVLVLIVGPLTTAIILMADQANDLLGRMDEIRAWIAAFSWESHPAFQILPSFVQERLSNLDVSAVIASIAAWVAANIDTVFLRAADVTFKTFIFFICLYYFLADRDRLKEQMLRLSPFKDGTDRSIIDRMALTVRAVVTGSLIVAVVQGVLAGIGMTIFGVPGALIWAGVVIVAANIPFVGTSLVLVPVIAYLLLTGHVTEAIGLTVWAALLVGGVDNFLKPYLVEGKTRMHALLILLSILGGLQVFGPIGLIVGPTVLAALLALTEMYKAGVLEKNSV